MEATEDNCVTVLKSNYEIEIKVNFSNLEERYNGDKLSPVHQKVNIMNFFFGVVRIADLSRLHRLLKNAIQNMITLWSRSKNHSIHGYFNEIFSILIKEYSISLYLTILWTKCKKRKRKMNLIMKLYFVITLLDRVFLITFSKRDLLKKVKFLSWIWISYCYLD